MTRLGGDVRVHTLVTLGTPHEGSWAHLDTDGSTVRPGLTPLVRGDE